MSGSRPYRVLIVDDDPDHVFLMKIAFARLDPSAGVFTRGSAEEAQRYLQEMAADAEGARRRLPHVIVLDINMPGVGGLGFLEWYGGRQELAQIPVVVFTSAGDPELAQRCLAGGAYAFKEKPQDFGEVVPLVQSVLERRRSEAESRTG